MNRQELLKHFDDLTIDDSIQLNSLTVAIRQEFNRKNCLGTSKDFRNQAIDFVVEKKLPFQSEINCFYDLCKRFVKITCPYCNGETKVTDGGGSATSHSVTYRCNSCNAYATIHGPHDMLSFNQD